MPELVWLYLTALRHDRTSGRGSALAQALEPVSHDRLTRVLQAAWSGPTRLAVAWRPLVVWTRGALRLDDPVIAQPLATAIAGLAWVFSSQARPPVSGLSLVRLVWTNGTRRIPLGLRLWRKGGPSTHERAWAAVKPARSGRRGIPCPAASWPFVGWNGNDTIAVSAFTHSSGVSVSTGRRLDSQLGSRCEAPRNR